MHSFIYMNTTTEPPVFTLPLLRLPPLAVLRPVFGGSGKSFSRVSVCRWVVGQGTLGSWHSVSLCLIFTDTLMLSLGGRPGHIGQRAQCILMIVLHRDSLMLLYSYHCRWASNWYNSIRGALQHSGGDAGKHLACVICL